MPENKAKKRVGFTLAVILLAAPLVTHFEGIELKTYEDPVGIPTACIGETDKEIVLRGQFTRDECVAVLGASLAEHADGVSKCITRPIKPYEAAAVLSWSFNVGTGAACSSTLIRKLNAGEDFCPELLRWDKAGGRVLPGLTKRRRAEFTLCSTGSWSLVK